MSFLGMPTDVGEALDAIAAEPDASFLRVRYKDDLLIALRDEEGGLSAYRCHIAVEAHRDPNTVQPEATPPVATEAVDPRLPEDIEEAFARCRRSPCTPYWDSLRAAISSALGERDSLRDELGDEHDRLTALRCEVSALRARAGDAERLKLAAIDREMDNLRRAEAAESRASAAEARIAEVERACDMPLDMIATTLDAHRKTANEDHDRASAAADALRELLAVLDKGTRHDLAWHAETRTSGPDCVSGCLGCKRRDAERSARAFLDGEAGRKEGNEE